MRRRIEPTKVETPESLRQEYVMVAAWYYFRAEGADENLASALHRMQAHNMKRRFEALNIKLPSDGEIRAYAVSRWPEHKLHQEAH